MAAAADALSLTQGAVGHQIRALEDFVGQPLVSRQGRRMQLTEAGRIYGYQVRQALDDIAEATERLTLGPERATAQAGHVRVAVLPSFAQGWLLPPCAAAGALELSTSLPDPQEAAWSYDPQLYPELPPSDSDGTSSSSSSSARSR